MTRRNRGRGDTQARWIWHSLFKYSPGSVVVYIWWFVTIIWGLYFLCFQILFDIYNVHKERRLYGKLRHRTIYVYILNWLYFHRVSVLVYFTLIFFCPIYLTIYRSLFSFTVNFAPSVEGAWKIHSLVVYLCFLSIYFINWQFFKRNVYFQPTIYIGSFISSIGEMFNKVP